MRSHKKIDEFNTKWIKNSQKSLKPTDSIMISGTYQNIFSFNRILQKLDFKILNIITWKKTNSSPNFSYLYLAHSTKQIIWAKKSYKHKHIFNYKLLKKLNEDKQMKYFWSFSAISFLGENRKKRPKQKQFSLSIRLILEDFIICDPFSGSSTARIATNLLSRKFIGFEKEKNFIDISIARKNELDNNFFIYKTKNTKFKKTLKE